MKIKSLLVILLLSLFSIALEAQLYVDSSTEMVLMEQEATEIVDTLEENDDDKRLFCNTNHNIVDSYELVKKIDFQNTLSKQEFYFKIHKPPRAS